MTPAPPTFAEPWHANLFAVTVYLNEVGHFTWSDWAAAFGATLKEHGLSRELDGGDDYFTGWLETLEQILARDGTADWADLARLKQAWTDAYLSTPHGQPVHLDT